MMFLTAATVQAQITIGGNVYGGGNAGNTGGSTTVTVHAGDLNRVYGGARMANVGGRAFMNIDGAHASNYIVINRLYGGNDIAGTIGSSADELPDVVKDHAANNGVDKTWNALVLISSKITTPSTYYTAEDQEVIDGNKKVGDIKTLAIVAEDNKPIYIGQLFGGGDGEYTYGSRTEGTNTVYYAEEDGVEVATSSTPLTVPDLGKTFVDIHGGSIVYAYGGGNNATITEKTVISMDNPSAVVNSITDAANPNADASGEVLNNARFEDKMGINTTFSYPSSDAYQIGRFFGGNNKADMAIRPRWNLQQGRVRNLYGGGNEGRMTSPEGLLLQIQGAGMVVDNVYGGCRKADVKPLYNNNDATPVPYNEVALDPADNPNHIPAGYAARVRVVAGHVNNVYGGNDISGNVYAGNTVGIMTHIYGDVYGGGNGSYAYTDNAELKNDPRWSDFYYNPDEVLAAAGITGVSEKLKSVTALNLIRPNAEKVSILVRGTEGNPTIVDGGLYVGGNSASLRENIAGSSSGDQTHIKIGSHVIIDNVFLGNNGENMIKYNEADSEGRGEGVLRTLARTDLTSDNSKFNSMDLKNNADVFAKYMEGCAMKVKSTVVFESTKNGDGVDYVPYSTQFGSFYCGGNVGSMITDGKTTINFNDKVIVYDKVVGGCNNAFVTPTDYNALYEGGITGDPDPAPAGSPAGTIGDKLQLNFAGLKIQPKRWNAGHTALEWNTISAATGQNVDPVTSGASSESPVTSSAADKDRRLKGGNIYGGCYNSGVVNGNIVININNSVIDRDIVFDEVEEDATGEDKLYDNDEYHITKRNSGVILAEQGMDVLGSALNLFGGGKGVNTEIWGSTTINLNRGYIFQIFGGSEEGGIGKADLYNELTGKLEYSYDPRYSTYINLNGPVAGVSKLNDMTENMAECEFIYGGGFLGPVAGNCIINLNNGRIFNSFAGACNADVLGHTETHIGTNGFPYVRDFLYGGNDLGGKILRSANFDSRLRNDAVRAKVSNTDMLNASAYIEYVQGHVEKIFGGAYGVYDYKDAYFREYFDEDGHAKTGYHKPFLNNAFINFRPIATNNPLNTVNQIYGAGQGFLGEEEEDLMQNSSYILIDVPQTMQYYQGTEIFGAGECGGVGMGVAKATADAAATAHKASAVIDLLSGQFKAVYGGSYQEGVTRRTMINVPEGSTFRCEKIFGGAYGLYNEYPCDVYEANVNWNSSDAIVGGYRTGIYGGNNNCRRTLYSKININAPVYYDKANSYYATVYGAGYGKDTWSQYTEVNLNNTARVYEVYGGGQLGRVMNKKSVDAWKVQVDAAADEAAAATSTTATHIDLSLGSDYTDNGLNDALATARNGKKYNTNVIINQGADVCGYMYNGSLSGAYAYGGGLGDANTSNTGDVHGTTYIALLGGRVTKDLYAAGTVGSVNNRYNVSTDDFNQPFIASANAYVEGGTARNVYGGGWRGSVGYHAGEIDAATTGDVLGETNVVIGKLDGTSFLNGIPAIERNAYGGGEGGPVFGTTNITLNKGFIGYRHFDSAPTTDTDLDTLQVWSGTAPYKKDYYQEKLNDETWSGDGTNRLFDSGCIFGGGYIDNSSVDVTNVKMYGGHVRNALFGGGEIAAIGRGIINATGTDNSVRTLQGIYKAGRTTVELYEGQVHRNVFGGGRGYNNLGEGGTLYSDGYVFGQTEVHIYGGEVGSDKGMEKGYGNVFGGGDIGYVYSAYEKDGKLYVGIKDGNRYDDKYEGYYYAYDLEMNDGPKAYIPADFEYDEKDQKWVMDGTEYVLTEDCKVLVEPHPKALSAVTINGHNYTAGQYVPIEDLNTLGNKNSDTKWNSLDPTGIIIHNAVFAGGNTSSGSSTVYANATTVFGNATASINDVYHRDLITLGTGHTGGLYGDGNLTFVDGYRGLNITNYGTDYYSIAREITIAQYEALPAREAAYYELRYQCIKECIDNDGTSYYPAGGDHTKASTLTADDIYSLFKNTSIENFFNADGSINTNLETGYWKENGVLPVYAGRLMNTIQRADFCGVFGSRMVMQGAQDRVPEIVDHTNYTINRVREVSLNQKHSVISDDLTLKDGKTAVEENFPEDQNPDDFADLDKAIHGNYFGIYNIVNYLGALTSDVHFMADKDIRRTDNSDTDTYGPTGADDQTYYNWKKKYVKERKRNNGTSLNKVALASGVYLELYTEKVQGTDLGLYEKDWGYITGVIELDLINVQPGIGGGFVYAKNEHRVGTYEKKKHTTLTALNADAITRKDFTYNGALVEWETSGNFVHGTQIIIDDCYNVSGKYEGTVEPGGAVPAHYWFIKGSVYVYDQYISAYTGAPNAYSESVDIPLTITAASHGTMKLLNVMPNKYAYYASPGNKLEEGKKIIINDIEYRLNDPISYWNWYLLTKSEQALFVDQTYVTTAECKVGTAPSEVTYPAGSVFLPEDYATLKAAHPTVYHVALEKEVDFDFVFRSSNNLGHDTGYMLTYKVNNPTDWNTWYTEKDDDHDNNGTIAKAHEKNQTGGTGYEDGPTYYLTSGEGGVFGQRDYKVSNLISKDVYDTYQNIVTNHLSAIPTGQATFEGAYLVTQEYTSGNVHLNVGSSVSATQAASMTGHVAPAYICTATIPLSKTEFIYVNTRMTEAEKTEYYNRFHKEGATAAEENIAKEILDNIVPAYYCTHDGLYGGDYYEAGKNYRGLGIWCSMSKSDREKFTFNYDAFDLLIDPNFSKDPTTGTIIHGEGQKYQYDSAGGTLDAAEANPAGYSLPKPVNYTATYNGDATSEHNGVTLAHGTEYSRADFEKLPNEKRHYSAIDVKAAGKVYVVKSPFQVGNSPYAVGTVISASTYGSLGETDQANIATLEFAAGDVSKIFYFCRESYKVNENTEGVSVTNASVTGSETGTYTNGQTVPIGLVISSDSYNALKNWQTDFTIHGIAPTETSTLYVSRESDLFNLSTEKIITVVYQYDYEESDASGAHVTPISERHVVNIHLQFKSGIPTVEDIKAPQIVLPGTFVGVREPHVTPGAYEVTGGGWRLFEKIGDAESHINGIDYVPTFDPLYWYQDGYYLAYYAKTYLGETYSNAVQVSVANYHDLKKVLEDTDHHYYVDRKDVKRNSKIYINDATNGATQLKQFFDLSKSTLDEHVRDCQNLEFFLHTNVTMPSGSPAWTPIGDATHCFSGNFHGDGYHIDGLDHSLFGSLCGNVYNLGVTGSFTSAGVADTGSGYVENCWINTTGTPDGSVHAVFGTPTASGFKRVNCYYPETLNYKKTDDGHGLATPMPKSAFYNGTVAYNLNGFYLYKRYNDHETTSGTAYKYYTINTDGTLSAPQTKYYAANNAEYCSSGVDGVYANGGYVEDRYADGDFRYADGVIPENQEERMFVDQEEKVHFYPVWPDDYIYFGQMLTYGWNDLRPHQGEPSRIVKNNGRLSTTDESNRIYRAPAYYQSKAMNVAHFNPSVNLVAFSKPKNNNDKNLQAAYPNMTAIDFAGHNDMPWAVGVPTGTTLFYPPLLDESGLNSITNRDESPNLLVYAPAEAANKKTYDVLTEYFTEPAYNDYYSSTDKYRRVAAAPTWTIFGHLIQSDFTAISDHLLVDKQDFNCPMRYTFDSGKRMWYQRTPDHFVSLTNGWSTVSLPFTAELVSTQDKGEITHFYSGSPTIEGSDAKIGHEYWLREYKGGAVDTNDATVFKATFNYPDADAAGADKLVKNTFLWDYYYSKNGQQDANTDTYQTYYNTSRNFEAYPLLATAKPYIVGFPGKTYYEFDLSGEWTAKNTANPAPEQLGKQTISFVSVPEITIEVSDDELSATSDGNYGFVPNYMSKVVDGYLMNDDGNRFDKTPTSGLAATPFRPYFVADNAGARQYEHILFDSNDSSFAFGDDKDPSGDDFGEGDLVFTIRKHMLSVTSSLRREADVRIVNMSGLTIATFTIQPGETIDTNIGVGGVYMVRADGGRIQKKLAIK